MDCKYTKKKRKKKKKINCQYMAKDVYTYCDLFSRTFYFWKRRENNLVFYLGGTTKLRFHQKNKKENNNLH